MSFLDDIAQRAPSRRIVTVGGAVTALPLIATVWGAGWVDLALVAVSTTAAIATGALLHTRRQLGSLPLVLGPTAARSVVDGVVMVRFRACLGRGRTFRPSATVRFEGPDGAVTLPLRLPEGPVCGPLILCVVAPPGEGAYHVEITAQEGDATWAASGRFPTAELVEGRFDEGISAGPPLRFTDGWDKVSGGDRAPG